MTYNIVTGQPVILSNGFIRNDPVKVGSVIIGLIFHKEVGGVVETLTTYTNRAGMMHSIWGIHPLWLMSKAIEDGLIDE